MTFWRVMPLCVVTLFAMKPVWGQQSGVLVGFLAERGTLEAAQSFDEIKEPKYQTQWIALDETGKLAVLATIPRLIVPTTDGFFHVGVKQVCEFSPSSDGQDGGNESIRQAVWAAPTYMPGVVHVSRLCTENAPIDNGRSEQSSKRITQCGNELVEIEYLSPALISIRKYDGQSEDCEPRGGRYNVVFNVIGFESDEALTVSQVLGDEARAAYLKALPKSAEIDGGDVGDCAEPMNDDSGWRIDRHHGRWALFAHQDLGYFGCHVDAFVPFRLRSNVTGDNSPVPDWNLLKTKVQDLRDAYVSPANDLLIVMTGTAMEFHQYAEGGPGKLLLTLPTRGIVMLQWSTGKHVEDWTKQLQAIAAQPLPEPRIQTHPAKN